MLDLKKLIKENPTIVSTCTNDKPNIAVASDVALIDNKTIIIAHNEMHQTIKNILKNSHVALLILNRYNEGVRIFGNAKYYNDDEHFAKVNELFKNETTTPLGAIVVKIDEVREIK